MAAHEDFSKISDVAYLITSFRIAGKRGDREKKEAILNRLREMGMLDSEGIDYIQRQNLRTRIEQNF